MAMSSERSPDVPTCMRCERTFSSHRGLDIHRNRAHPVSDNFVIDFLNLPHAQQEEVLRIVAPDGKPIDLDQIVPRMVAIVSSPQSRAENTTLRSALAKITGVEYRYMISEEP